VSDKTNKEVAPALNEHRTVNAQTGAVFLYPQIF